MLEPGLLSTYPTCINYLSTLQLSFGLLLAWGCLVTSFFDSVPPGSRFRARGGVPRFTQRLKTDFLTTLEFNQISDPTFDASELDFGALWSSKRETFRTLESTFSENGDLKDLLIFSM